MGQPSLLLDLASFFTYKALPRNKRGMWPYIQCFWTSDSLAKVRTDVQTS